MYTNKLPYPKAGDAIRSEHIRQLSDAIVAIRPQPTQGGGATVGYTAGVGTTVRVNPMVGYLGRTDGVVSARSGTTAGTGTVILQDFDGSDLSDSGLSVEVFNFGASSGEDAFVWVTRDVNGRWWLVAEGCDVG